MIGDEVLATLSSGIELCSSQNTMHMLQNFGRTSKEESINTCYQRAHGGLEGHGVACKAVEDRLKYLLSGRTKWLFVL